MLEGVDLLFDEKSSCGRQIHSLSTIAIEIITWAKLLMASMFFQASIACKEEMQINVEIRVATLNIS